VGLLSRIFRPSAAKSVEGQYRDGPWYLPLSGGWLPQSVGQNLNWWQMGFDPIGSETTSMVEACVSAYSQTVAMCPGDHWRANDKGGRKRVTNSALARLLRTPNDYQSISDFLLNLTRSLYLDGNAYALALRNDRFEITELHLMHPRHSMAQIAPTGEIFYSLGGNPIIDHRMSGLENKTLLAPQRDVLHVRLQTPMHPLRGESPIRSALIDIATSGAMSQQQFAFYLNQGRPSNVLATDLNLTKEQVEQLRDRWNDQSQRLAQGGTPILTNGLKPIPIYTSSRDAQLAEMMKLSEQHIALAFRMPLQILGISSGGSSSGAGTSTELLMHSWIAQGLGFALNHIEESLGQLFSLKGQPGEYVEFSTAVLLRSSMKDRIAALAQGVQGGIYAPNEARAVEELPAVEYGDEPRVQQQVVPLSAAAGIPSAPPSPPASPAPANPDVPAADPGSKKDFDAERVRSRFRGSQNAHAGRIAA
jgi:HK97 family phage portal protein